MRRGEDSLAETTGMVQANSMRYLVKRNVCPSRLNSSLVFLLAPRTDPNHIPLQWPAEIW